MNSSIKEICGIMRRDKAKGAMMYVPELSWLLFLRFLDLQEIENEKRLKAVGKSYTPIIQKPFRWRESILNIVNNGVKEFIEIGPGKVLSGLVKRIDRNMKLYQINSLSDLEKKF